MMRPRLIAFLLVVLAFSCHRGPAAPSVESAASPGEIANTGTDPAQEQRRRGLVREELERYDLREFSFDASTLEPRDQALLAALIRAADLIEELHLLQIHPQSLEWRDRIAEVGTDDDRELFRRYQRPWCIASGDPLCTALPGVGRQPTITFHWPEGLTDDEFEAIGRAPNRRELLSPFTVVRRDGQGAWRAGAYSRTERLGPRMGQVAEALRAAAEHADTESLATFLRSRADAFEADGPFPWDSSDYDWINLDSRFEVTVGPYETYRDPRELKAQFEMLIGVIDPEMSREFALFGERLQEMEEMVAGLAGSDIYQPRQLDTDRIVIRAIRMIYATGDDGRTAGVLAYHLPNRGPALDEGFYKNVIVVNHCQAHEPDTEVVARHLLVPEQVALFSAREDMINAAFHEYAHGLGAHDELAITVGGRQTTVGAALGSYTTFFEELKANIVGLWLMEQLRQRGLVSDEQAERRYLAYVLSVLSFVRHGIFEAYTRGSAIQIGLFMERGALVLDEGTGRFRIDMDRIPEVVEELARQVVRIQLTGDRDGAAALYARYATLVEGGRDQPNAALARTIGVIAQGFRQANVRHDVFRYRVTGLPDPS